MLPYLGFICDIFLSEVILVLGEIGQPGLDGQKSPFGSHEILSGRTLGGSSLRLEMLEDLVLEGERVGQGIGFLVSWIMRDVLRGLMPFWPSLRASFLIFLRCCLTLRSILYLVLRVFLLVGLPLALFENFTIGLLYY